LPAWGGKKKKKKEGKKPTPNVGGLWPEGKGKGERDHRADTLGKKKRKGWSLADRFGLKGKKELKKGTSFGRPSERKKERRQPRLCKRGERGGDPPKRPKENR